MLSDWSRKLFLSNLGGWKMIHQRKKTLNWTSADLCWFKPENQNIKANLAEPKNEMYDWLTFLMTNLSYALRKDYYWQCIAVNSELAGLQRPANKVIRGNTLTAHVSVYGNKIMNAEKWLCWQTKKHHCLIGGGNLRNWVGNSKNSGIGNKTNWNAATVQNQVLS